MFCQKKVICSFFIPLLLNFYGISIEFSKIFKLNFFYILKKFNELRVFLQGLIEKTLWF